MKNIIRWGKLYCCGASYQLLWPPQIQIDNDHLRTPLQIWKKKKEKHKGTTKNLAPLKQVIIVGLHKFGGLD